jgi:DNA-binding XRE family transcriptional regulator
MKGLRGVPKILKINNIDGYKVSLLFSNGESRIIDFEHLLKNVFQKEPGKIGYELLEDIKLFNKIKIVDTSIGWEDIGIEDFDENGNKLFYPYDLDPLVLYQHSIPDEERNIIVGLSIKQARIEAGLTQEELAEKSGTSKHYISRLENNKSDIELMTLKKIVEAGLGRHLKIQIV